MKKILITLLSLTFLFTACNISDVERAEKERQKTEEENIKKEKFPLQVSDMAEPGKAHLISELMKEERPWKLVISYDEDNAKECHAPVVEEKAQEVQRVLCLKLLEDC